MTARIDTSFVLWQVYDGEGLHLLQRHRVIDRIIGQKMHSCQGMINVATLAQYIGHGPLEKQSIRSPHPRQSTKDVMGVDVTDEDVELLESH